MPQLGESIAEATIVKILFKEGDSIEADKDIIEVETNKAVMGLTAPCSGVLFQIHAEEGQSYPVGAILGYIEVTAEEALRLGLDDKPPANRSNRPSAGCPSRPTPAVPAISLPA